MLLAAGIVAVVALVVGCTALHLILWGIAAYADHHRAQLRCGPRADISNLH